MLLEFPALMLLLMLLCIASLVWLPYRWHVRAGVTPGLIDVHGRKYSYEIGDFMLRYGGSSEFSGIEVVLPKRLPHIFLDAHHNNQTATKEYVFDHQNRLSLEGDFDQYFQAYAPAQHKVLALSILSPDVLQVLKRSATKYDIEIIDDKVRLMVPGHHIGRDEAAKEELLYVAELLLIEIDHRLQSWNESSLQGDTMLDVRAMHAVPLGRHVRVRRRLLLLAVSLLIAALVLVLYYEVVAQA